MSPRERIRRPDLERTEPIRNWSGMFRRPEPRPADGPAEDKATGEDPRGGEWPSSGVREGVELGYRVIEDYLQQGRNVAQQLRGQRNGFKGSTATEHDPVQQWLKASKRLSSAWLELLGSLSGLSTMGRPSGQNGSQKPDPFGPSTGSRAEGFDPRTWAETWAETRPPGAAGDPFEAPRDGFSGVSPRASVLERITLEVASSRPVRISLDLDPESDYEALGVLELTCSDAGQPALDTIGFEPASDRGGLCLCLAVAPDVAEDLYTGRVVDTRSGEVRGILSLQILPAPA